jgi:tetratricopeptide (TPR) repeat protein/O-antigen ligase
VITAKGEPSMTRAASLRYLLQETLLVLLLGYALLLGGTYNGLVLSDLRLVTTVLIAVVGGVWIAVRLVRRWPFPRTPLDIPLLGYLAVHVITAILSSDPRRSAIYVWLLGVYVLLFYLFVDLLQHGWPAELFVKALLIVSVIVLGFGLRELALWYGAWHDIWGWARVVPTITTRVHAFLGHPNWVAAFLNLLWPLALLRLSSTRARLPRLLLGAWLLAALVLIYFTSSRGGWLGTAVAAGLIVLLAGSVRKRLRQVLAWLTAKRLRLIPAGVITLGVGFVVVALLARQLSHPSHGGLLETRQHFWQAALVAFRAAPIGGTGPFTYGETFLTTHSVPPDDLFGVAHNYVFNLAAESGLLGLGALAWLVVALARGLWRFWQRSSGEQRAIQLGALAALASCAAHSFFDSIETVPALCLVVALVLALCLNNEPPPLARRRNFAWALPVAWASLLVSAIWSLGIYRIFSQGVLAASLDQWSEATPLLDSAARRDPNVAYYHLQAGYAHGVRAASGDADELAAAIAHYQAGIALSPHYALNAANLGSLYRQAGDREQAIRWTQRAAEQAPGSAVIALNLGRLYEETDQAALASQWYNAALDRAPDWDEAAFWRSTPLRVTVASVWRAAHPPPAPAETPHSIDEWLITGSNALAVGHTVEALAAFEQATVQDPNRIAAYVGQANAYEALGRNGDAERALRTAMMAEGGTRFDRLRAQFALGRLYYDGQNVGKAVALYEDALNVVGHPSIYGPGGQGASDYGWYLFYSETISSDLLPQLAVITVTDEIAAHMMELGKWYEEQGNTAAALSTYHQVLDTVPDLAQARERVHALEEP